MDVYFYDHLVITCSIIPSESHLKKLIATSLSSFFENNFCETCIIDWAYLFLTELVSPPITKPPEMVLSVWRGTPVSNTSSVIFPFLVDDSPSSSLFENDISFLLILLHLSRMIETNLLGLGSWFIFKLMPIFCMVASQTMISTPNILIFSHYGVSPFRGIGFWYQFEMVNFVHDICEFWIEWSKYLDEFVVWPPRRLYCRSVPRPMLVMIFSRPGSFMPRLYLLLSISRYFIHIAFFTLNITFCFIHDFIHADGRLLRQRLIEMVDL